MANKRLIERIKDSLQKEGLVARTNAARTWLRQKVKEIKMPGGAKRSFVNNNKDKSRDVLNSRQFIGKMYFYFYDPKTKEQLPYYDTLPLVIPIEEYSDGFLGLNLHYIHPKYRIILLDKLSEILTDTRFDENTRMRISYRYLRQSKRFFEANPCIKRYLYSHVRSRFLEISADEWDIAALLPFEQFKKQSQVRVWADSKKRF